MYTYRNLFLFLLAASAFALGAAFIAQYGFNLHPCHLCILQRWPYAAVIALSVAGFFAQSLKLERRNNTFLILIVLMSILALFIDAGIATYHAGVEAKIFSGPDSCTNAAGGGNSIEELRAQIMNAPLVSCDQAMAHFMGLSMAAWNAIYAALAGMISLWIFYNVRKKLYAPSAG